MKDKYADICRECELEYDQLKAKLKEVEAREKRLLMLLKDAEPFVNDAMGMTAQVLSGAIKQALTAGKGE